MVEAINKILKYQYLFKHKIVNYSELEKYLPIYIDDNNARPHSVIMVSPNDASLGKIFDKEAYQNGLLAARKTRIQENSSCNRCGL